MFLLLGMGVGKTASSQNESHPYRIGRITIHRREVFDNRRAGWVGTLANKLHVLTREDVIRNELLFKEGDVYDPDLLDETERNLRALGIIGDVYIEADTVRNHRVNVSVYTHDRWTLGLKSTYKQEGGVRSMGLSLNDDNLLGSGQGLTLGYNYKSDRSNPNGAEIDFVEPRLFGSRYGMKLQYLNSEDAQLQSLLLSRSYFSEEATWAGSIYGDFGRQRYRQYENGMVVLQDNLVQEDENAWLSLSFGTRRRKIRLGTAYVRTRLTSSLAPATFANRLDLLNFSANFSDRVFYKGKYIENFGRVEDVPVGYALNIVAGPNLRFRDRNAADMFVRVDAEYATTRWKEKVYASISSSILGFHAMGAFRDVTIQETLVQHWRATAWTTLASRIQFSKGYNWSAGRQWLLGSPTGLLGYDANRFTGQQQILLNLQYRVFAPVTAWIFTVGADAFINSGTAWNSDQHFTRQQFHSSVGFGIMIENPAQQGTGIIRIDFPFNLDEGKFTEVVISSDQLFKAFSDLAFIAPNLVQ